MSLAQEMRETQRTGVEATQLCSCPTNHQEPLARTYDTRSPGSSSLP